MANNQTQRDTERARNRSTRVNNNDNSRTQGDTERANSRTKRGSQANFENDKRNEINRRFDSMEFNSGITLAGGDTTSGRDFYEFKSNNYQRDQVIDWGVFDDDSGNGGSAGSGGGGGAGGSGAAGSFAEEDIQYVDDNNAAKEKTFLVK